LGLHQTSVRRELIGRLFFVGSSPWGGFERGPDRDRFFVGIRAEFHRFSGRDQARSRSIAALWS